MLSINGLEAQTGQSEKNGTQSVTKLKRKFMTFSESQGVPESFKKTRLYQVLCAEKAEILRHKWIESEKAGRDIGFDSAVIDWSVNHRAAWRRAYVARFAAEDYKSYQMPVTVKAN